MFEAQLLKPIYVNDKWGYSNSKGEIIIEPKYDTAYSFDPNNQIALVANRSEFNKTINPITGEEQQDFDYYFINAKNQKLKLKDENFPDSVSVFPNQQELHLNYLDSSSQFKILFQNKVYLFSKTGKQLSGGFDNIYSSPDQNFYFTENFIEIEKAPSRIKGLINCTGTTIIKNKYHEIKINTEDSVLYCCSAVYTNKLNDDVFNFSGKLIYTNKKHIEFSSQHIHVLKSYEPAENFIIENDLTKKNYTKEGTEFLYLKQNKALIIHLDNWIIVDLLTGKEKKINKEKFFQNLNTVLEIN